MVGVVIECRLGNQLFQYAFIKALSKRYNTAFFINKNQEEFTAAEYFDLNGYHPRLNFFIKASFKLKNGSFFKSLQGTNHDGSIDTLTDNVVYRGYFQSELFFKNISGEVVRFIKIKKKYKQQFEAQYSDTFANNKIIAVHIRRGDYLDLNDWWAQNFGSNNLTLPADYYLESIKQVKDYQNYKIIFVSDDMDWAQSTFGHLTNAQFATNSMIIDFQIIMNADACIISNSSFSWWASYLNTRQDKQIFCPRYWLGFKIKKEYPENIIPAGWHQTEVNAN